MDIKDLRHELTHVIMIATNLESFICSVGDWLMRKIGYVNLGFWLAKEEDDLNLGAYMKYTDELTPELQAEFEKKILLK